MDNLNIVSMGIVVCCKILKFLILEFYFVCLLEVDGGKGV